MSDNYIEQNTDDEQQHEEGRNPLREQMRKMERDMKALREQAESGTAATRELAFVKAGVDTDTPLGQLIRDGYKGEMTTEAIASYAASLGATPPAAATGTPAQQAQAEADRQVFQQTPQLTQEGSPAAGRNWDAEINSAQSAEEVIRIYQERHGADSVKFGE